MLEQVDLAKKIPKKDYKAIVPELELRLGALQREARDLQIPILIVFEGWDAAGKGTLINRLIQTFDPRGCIVHPISAPNEEEQLRPFLWRFWIKTPEKGRIAVFDRSWYGRLLVERVDEIVSAPEWKRAYNEITAFERQLADDGTLILKFFLHISKKEQKKRFKALQKASATAWKVTKEDWKHHQQYETYLEAIEEMLAKTDTSFAPWTVVESHNKRFATLKVFKTVMDALEYHIDRVKHTHSSAVSASGESASEEASEPPGTAESSSSPDTRGIFDSLTSSVLDKVDLSLTLSREEYKTQLKTYQQRMFEIEHKIYVKRIPVVILYQGWDAAGKGGNIRRLTQSMDPRGYEVIPIAAPNDIEKSHHYLWRFWMAFPKAGHIAIFDRSWYGRVLVERIEGFCREQEWRRAYREINAIEEHMVNFGTVLVKFWLHIDQEEQLRRFQARQQTPHKRWKITDEDWRNREKWDLYKEAIDEMLFRTSTAYAPWTIIEANSKYYARIKALKTVIAAVEEKL
ncbi:phosphate--AMP phosphotransferase [candidate division KSB3 bacterium]|uniref:Phosphate--AMP phosphotransferase n=1 Tax=candidate division KSB3 bacterium TaxID=2044937 RepID=A0A9D5Q685_9BACT|nr:phosphate--AMP phosphotransferase [candidate division KSB3 bacterium]MBD3325574.1 phosphate--AMP phosphotransferase [candidate division KSB3 bacterium]